MSNDDHTLSAPWTILKTLQWTAGYFKRHGIDNPRIDAEILMAHVLACKRIDLYVNHDQPLHAGELERFKGLIQQRVHRMPVAYIIGTKEFWSLEFEVTPDVLIPRPETEGLVEAALKLHGTAESISVLELGTGSGIISIALAHERPHWRFWASDLSEKAIEIARINCRKHIPEDRIMFMVGNWFDGVEDHKGVFDLIVSNPPYIPNADLAGLDPDVRNYEPTHALDGGPDGLTDILHIISKAPDYLKPGGGLILEIGYDQGPAVQSLADQAGVFDDIVIEKDYSGHDRVARFRVQKSIAD